MMSPIYIHEFAVVCALGDDAQTVAHNLLSATPQTVCGEARLVDGRVVPVGVAGYDPVTDKADTRCNQLADRCLSSLRPALTRHMSNVPPNRVAVVAGTSTSGVREVGDAVRVHARTNEWPREFRLGMLEHGDVAAHVARQTGARGPAYGISTACTSGAKALVAAARLLRAGLCDLAIAGGIDSLCDLTLNGFASLESLSETVCNPFSINRRGINLGEGGALFLLSMQPSEFMLAGWGESADAYHISAPDPEGTGAEAAMLEALGRAGCGPQDIDYLNLHGTATRLNDSMEARAVARVLGLETPCSSTKPMTGHMLGAAGACEAAFALMALRARRLPAHIWDGARDPELPPIRLVDGAGERSDIRRAMSCSYAFGGNNVALILEAA
jgi:3-oxoacyl-[acyl-carrier-protein] synthase-1